MADAPWQIRDQLPQVALSLHANGPGAEAQIRTMCHGVLPVVGPRFVLVCADVHRGPDGIQVQFHFMPLPEDDEGA